MRHETSSPRGNLALFGRFFLRIQGFTLSDFQGRLPVQKGTPRSTPMLQINSAREPSLQADNADAAIDVGLGVLWIGGFGGALAFGNQSVSGDGSADKDPLHFIGARL